MIPFTIRLNKTDHLQLKNMAKARPGTSISKIVREAVQKLIKMQLKDIQDIKLAESRLHEKDLSFEGHF